MDPFAIERDVHRIIIDLELETYRLVLQPDSDSIAVEDPTRLDFPQADPGFDLASDNPKLLRRLIYPAEGVLIAGDSLILCVC